MQEGFLDSESFPAFLILILGAEVAKDAQMSYVAEDVSTQKPSVSFQTKQAH